MITSTGDLKKRLNAKTPKIIVSKAYSPKLNLTTRMRLRLTWGLLD